MQNNQATPDYTKDYAISFYILDNFDARYSKKDMEIIKNRYHIQLLKYHCNPEQLKVLMDLLSNEVLPMTFDRDGVAQAMMFIGHEHTLNNEDYFDFLDN